MVGVAMVLEPENRRLTESLASLCDQTFEESRCVVVDAGATDADRILAEEHASADRRVTLVRPAERTSWSVALTRALDELGD